MTNIRVETEKLQSVAGQLKSNSSSIGGVGGRLLNAGSSARTYDNNSFGPKVRAICTDSNARALNIGGILGGMAGMLNRKVNAFIQADSIFSQEMGKKNLSFEFPSLIGIDARGEINDLINSKRYKFVEDQWNKMDIEQRKHFLNKFQASLLFLYGYPLASDEIIFTDTSGYIKKNQFNFLSFKGAYVNTRDSILGELCDKIVEHYDEVPFQWGGWARIDKNLTPELCKKMYDSGCHHLTFGFESGCPRINKEMRKGYKWREYSNEYAANVFKNCMDAGIKTVLFLIIGFPTETDEDFQETMKFLKEYKQYIDAVYCMSTFILSNEMIDEKEKFHLKDNKFAHMIEWQSDMNTYEQRLDRLEIFRKYAEENGLTTISPRLPDQVATPSQGTTMD